MSQEGEPGKTSIEDDLEMEWNREEDTFIIFKVPENLPFTNVEKFYRVETRLKHFLGRVREGLGSLGWPPKVTLSRFPRLRAGFELPEVWDTDQCSGV